MLASVSFPPLLIPKSVCAKQSKQKNNCDGHIKVVNALLVKIYSIGTQFLYTVLLDCSCDCKSIRLESTDVFVPGNVWLTIEYFGM